MPLIDMPMEELLQYQGRNPKPADFEQYWDRGLAEVRATDPRVELRQRKSNVNFAECFDLFFTGVGGARVHAKYLRPIRSESRHPAIVQFHGYGGHAGEWNEKYGYAAQGYSVLSLDVRGQSGESQDVGGHIGRTNSGHFVRGIDGDPDSLLYRSVYLDCAQLAGIALELPEVDPERVYATGGSQGGGLTIACAGLEPRIKRAATVFPFLCDYKRVWEMDLASGAYTEIRDYFRTFDPEHKREDQFWNQMGYVDVQHLAPRIKANVLLVLCLSDTICPPSTQFAAYNKIRGRKEMIVFPDFGHEWPPTSGDQIFEWLTAPG